MDELESRQLIQALKVRLPSCEGHITQEVLVGILQLIESLDERIVELQVAEDDC